MKTLFATLFTLILIVTSTWAQSNNGNGNVATKENLDLPFDAIGNSEEEEDIPEIIFFY
jgi:hypothetical protein